MTILYSPSETGFFDTNIHVAEQIPHDALPVSAERRIELLEGLAKGQVIEVGEDNTLELVDPPVNPEYVLMLERAWRDAAIEQVRWLRERHRDQQELQMNTTLSDAQFSELLTYIQQLRDWPESGHFPDSGQRPDAPSWIAGQLN